ncbi:MAG: hypothetical protein RLZZ628_1538 [Bacteroidota bacterium]|jgi:hypothetical protein
MKYLIFSFLFIPLFSPCIAQTKEAIKAMDEHLDSVDSIAESKPRLEIGGSYVSLVSFNGRTEGIEQYGLSPTVTAHLGKGWSLAYEGAIWSATSPKYAFSSIGLTKTFEAGEFFEGSIGYSRWLLHNNTAIKKGDFSNNIDLDTHWNLGDFQLGNTATILFGTGRALFFEPTISYEWSGRWGKERLFKWNLKPMFTADYGNDVATKLGARALARNTNKKSVKILNYDAALEGKLTYKATDCAITYHYDLPQNTIAPNPVNPFSYWEVSVIHSFGF